MRRCKVKLYVNRDLGWDWVDRWLVQMVSVNGYIEAVVADEHGLLGAYRLPDVQLQVPTPVDLLHGAPRRGEHGDPLPADEN